MRDRFLAEEVWENVGLDPVDCVAYVETCEMMQQFRKMLFSRIVPTIKDLGLFGEKVQRAFEDIGVIDFQDVDPDDLATADEEIAQRLDRAGRREQVDAFPATEPLRGMDPARAAEVQAAIDAGSEE